MNTLKTTLLMGALFGFFLLIGGLVGGKGIPGTGIPGTAYVFLQ